MLRTTLTRTTARTATPAAFAVPKRFDSSVKSSQEGGQQGFDKKERSEENRYVKMKEAETLKKLKEAAEAAKKHSAELESQVAEFEKKSKQ